MFTSTGSFESRPHPARSLMAVGAPGPGTVVVLVASQLALVGLNYRLQGGSEAASCAPPPLSEGPAVAASVPVEGYPLWAVCIFAGLTFFAGVGAAVACGACLCAFSAIGAGLAGGTVAGAVAGSAAKRVFGGPAEPESDVSGLIDTYNGVDGPGPRPLEIQDW